MEIAATAKLFQPAKALEFEGNLLLSPQFCRGHTK
jgi:hypothetical protein